ncbi:hypothetical protein QMG83_13135 [Salinibacterium sp. G-O1]|uniref:hypothetical protein n=1 Tax=Salinibacterium sp. G-O1 TaxID=3046208 RepID=UPI0024B9D031|nr:hypothetical protein [Salinibacterium sp. G-O1]MDJ0336169.1 hypothetical protein [Salinibacterium sp. G-O1]
MARSGSREGQGRRRPRAVVIAVVVAMFVIVDVALIGYAVMRSDPPSPGATPGPIPTYGSSDPNTTAPTPTADPVAVPAEPRHLVVTGASAGWRSTTGTCQGQSAAVESTNDGGATWKHVNPPGVHEVLYLSANASLVTVVAKTGDACALEVLKSFTGGQFWKSYPDEIASYTYLDPAEPASVQTPGGSVSAPCAAIKEVERRDDAILAACDNELFEKPNANADWSVAAVPGLLSVTVSDAGYTLAVSGDADCAGVSIKTLPAPIGTGPPAAVGCVELEVAPTQVSVAQAGSDVWLWTSDRVFVSSDGGASWS